MTNYNPNHKLATFYRGFGGDWKQKLGNPARPWSDAYVINWTHIDAWHWWNQRGYSCAMRYY